MTLDIFTKNFAALFPEKERASIAPETPFREIPGWNSLIALSVIAMTEDDCGVLLRGEDIRNAKTVRDIFNAAQAKKS